MTRAPPILPSAPAPGSQDPGAHTEQLTPGLPGACVLGGGFLRLHRTGWCCLGLGSVSRCLIVRCFPNQGSVGCCSFGWNFHGRFFLGGDSWLRGWLIRARAISVSSYSSACDLRHFVRLVDRSRLRHYCCKTTTATSVDFRPLAFASITQLCL